MNPLTAGQRAAMAETTSATFETPATRRRFGVVEDDYGNEVEAGAPDELELDVVLWQTEGTETTVDRDELVSDWIARLPLGADVTGRDLLIVDGKTFEVVGPPVDARTHLRARLRHVEG